MKTAIVLVAIWGCALALPSPSLDWSKIKANDVYVEPINNITYPSSRVIGGTEVTPNSIPYQVALIINGGSFCGGSLIARGWVLTAAHCTISASYVQLILGAHNVRVTESTQVIVTSTSVINHPQYDSRTLFSDVSLVRTPSLITLNNNIQLLPLAPQTAGTYAGSSGLLTGWGRISDATNTISPTLQRVNLNIISNAVCASTYGTSVVVSSTLCTSGSGVVGGCNGDSGGPIVVNGIQVGVTSFVSARGCQSGLPTGFGRVSSFRAWIDSNIS